MQNNQSKSAFQWLKVLKLLFGPTKTNKWVYSSKSFGKWHICVYKHVLLSNRTRISDFTNEMNDRISLIVRSFNTLQQSLILRHLGFIQNTSVLLKEQVSGKVLSLFSIFCDQYRGFVQIDIHVIIPIYFIRNHVIQAGIRTCSVPPSSFLFFCTMMFDTNIIVLVKSRKFLPICSMN